jgi:hypothetical protein
MRALMAYRVIPLALVAVASVVALGGLGACGKEIGDACSLSSDCDPNGGRLCDPEPSSPGGYCTVLGCDYSTCPDNSACIQFFTGNFTSSTCDPATEATDLKCSFDEICAITKHCVPRSSEVRYCMRTCSSNGDCRDGYECRDYDKMVQHGGQPVLGPDRPVDEDHASSLPKFCAVAPRA